MGIKDYIKNYFFCYKNYKDFVREKLGLIIVFKKCCYILNNGKYCLVKIEVCFWVICVWFYFFIELYFVLSEIC